MRGVESAPKSIVFFSKSMSHPQIAQIFTDSKSEGQSLKIICVNLCNLWINQKRSFRRDAERRDTRALPQPFCYKCGMKIYSLSILCLIFSASAFAQQPSLENIAASELPSLLAIYKDIHSHPELSGHEEQTSALIAKELRAAGCEVTDHFGKYDNP